MATCASACASKARSGGVCAWQAQNQPLRALRAQAEAQVAIRDFSAAQDRLKAAQDLARRGGNQDHIEASIIDTRLRAVTELLREEARKQ